jgi:IS1 family transposase
MNRLSTEARARIIGMLCEGMSMRATARLTGVSVITVMKLLVDAGIAAQEFHDKTVRGLACKRVQVDEIWAFCYAKQAHLSPEHAGKGYGDIWTWTAIDADTKIVVAWLTGTRKAHHAHEFVADLASRLTTRPQITSDGHSGYIDAIEAAFVGEVDYAQQIKIYSAESEGQRRYSPPVCTGTKKQIITGNPDWRHISTSYAERQNLNVRMHNRRFTRLTNAFSKKAENHAHAFALQTLHHNFARIHTTLRVTPAIEAGLTDHVWSLEEIVGVLERRESNVA